MLTSSAATQDSPLPGTPSITPQRIAVGRALPALGWAGAVVIALGGDMPQADAGAPTAVAALLATYPLIDVAASILTSNVAGTDGRVHRVNAAISALAVVAVAVAGFGFDAGALLATFGAWAAVSGALQLGVAVRDRRGSRPIPMMISGGLSTIAGLSFVAAAGDAEVNLAALGGYMAAGAALSLIWALRQRTPR